MGSNESTILQKNLCKKTLNSEKLLVGGGGVALILTLLSPGDRVDMERRQRLLCLHTRMPQNSLL